MSPQEEEQELGQEEIVGYVDDGDEHVQEGNFSPNVDMDRHSAEEEVDDEEDEDLEEEDEEEKAAEEEGAEEVTYQEQDSIRKDRILTQPEQEEAVAEEDDDPTRFDEVDLSQTVGEDPTTIHHDDDDDVDDSRRRQEPQQDEHDPMLDDDDTTSRRQHQEQRQEEEDDVVEEEAPTTRSDSIRNRQEEGANFDHDDDEDEPTPARSSMRHVDDDPNRNGGMNQAVEEPLQQQEEDDGPAIKQEEDEYNYASPPQPSTLSFEDLPTTGVDGEGMWRAWTRVFELSQDACLDLLDNCFDAALHDPLVNPDFAGHVVMNPLPNISNGIYIINNSKSRIRTLKEALTVYKSAKNVGIDGSSVFGTQTKRKEAIGENGVGLKHGCATLSDTTFVLTRNKNEVEFGVIAKALQNPKGVYLPSFSFTVRQNHTIHNIQDQIMEIMFENVEVQNVLSRDLGHGDITKGIERLAEQCEEMFIGEKWKNEWYVFQLVVCNLNYEPSSSTSSPKVVSESRSKKISETSGASTEEAIDLLSDDDDDGEQEENRGGVDQAAASEKPNEKFLNDMKSRLPRHYINVPKKSFDFYINGDRVEFTYWQQRLVELTKFIIRIPKTKLVEHIESVVWYDVGYEVNVYCGFDAKRVKDNASCSLYFYSREAGRLIMCDDDARAALGLAHTGSAFMQGLTLIIDDIGSQLPLMPTKDGIAWSEQKGGEIHKKNLYAKVKAIANCYWNHHLSRFAPNDKEKNKAKEILRRIVLSFADTAVDTTIDRMQDGKFTEFFGLSWKRTKSKIGYLTKTSQFMVNDGRDTLLKITDDSRKKVRDEMKKKDEEKSSKLTKKRKAAEAAEGLFQAAITSENRPEVLSRDDMVPYNRPRARAAINYRDDSDDEGGEESRARAAADSDEDDSSKKPAAKRNVRRKSNNSNAGTMEKSLRELELESEVAQLKLRLGTAESEKSQMRAEIENLKRKVRRKDGDIHHLTEEKRELEGLLRLMSPRTTRNEAAAHRNAVSPSQV